MARKDLQLQRCDLVALRQECLIISITDFLHLQNDVLRLEDDGDELVEAVLAQLASAHVQLLQSLRAPVNTRQLLYSIPARHIHCFILSEKVLFIYITLFGVSYMCLIQPIVVILTSIYQLHPPPHDQTR